MGFPLLGYTKLRDALPLSTSNAVIKRRVASATSTVWHTGFLTQETLPLLTHHHHNGNRHLVQRHIQNPHPLQL